MSAPTHGNSFTLSNVRQWVCCNWFSTDFLEFSLLRQLWYVLFTCLDQSQDDDAASERPTRASLFSQRARAGYCRQKGG